MHEKISRISGNKNDIKSNARFKNSPNLQELTINQLLVESLCLGDGFLKYICFSSAAGLNNLVK